MAATESDFSLDPDGIDAYLADEWLLLAPAIGSLTAYFVAKNPGSSSTGTEPADILAYLGLGSDGQSTNHLDWRVGVNSSGDFVIDENTGTQGTPTWTSLLDAALAGGVVTITPAVTVTGALINTGATTLSTSLALATGATVTAILDEDAMGSNSATALVTQQSVVAYVASAAGIAAFNLLTNETTVADADEFPFYDDTASANRVITWSALQTALEAVLDHDALVNFVANEHIDHTTISVLTSAISGLSGGGAITSNINLHLDPSRLVNETAIVAADEFAFWDDTASAARALTWTALLAALEAAGGLDHDSLQGFVANEHIDWTNNGFNTLVTTGTITASDVTGALGTFTQLDLGDGGPVCTAIADEDDMSSDSATLLVSQQSVKAYVDAGDSGHVEYAIAGEFSAPQGCTEQTLAEAAGVLTIDLADGNYFEHTLVADVTSVTISNKTIPGTYVIKMIQHASAPKTIVWGAAVNWPGGTDPTMTATNAAVDIISLLVDSAGAVYGTFAQDMK